MADIIGKPEGFTMVKNCLAKETNIDTVLSEKILQFKLPAAHSFRIPEGEAQGFIPLCPPRAFCHIRQRKDGGFHDSSREGSTCGEGGGRREVSTSELHTRLEGEVAEIRDFLEWVWGLWVWRPRFRKSRLLS